MAKGVEVYSFEGGVLHARKIAFERAGRLRDEYTPKIENFFDEPGFSNEKIQADLRYVQRRKSGFETTRFSVEQAKRAGVLEVILAEQIELSNWLGESVQTVFASEYDDIAHGVDFAIAFPELQESESRYLAIDVTFSEQQIETKLRRIKEAIDRGVLACIDYCQDSEGEKYSPGQVPQCILLFDESETDHFTQLWIEKRKKDLANHPFQDAIVEQLGCQLLMFEQYAKRIGNREFESMFLYMRELLALGLSGDRYQNHARSRFTTVSSLRTTLSDVFGVKLAFPNGSRSFIDWVYSLQKPAMLESKSTKTLGSV